MTFAWKVWERLRKSQSGLLVGDGNWSFNVSVDNDDYDEMMRRCQYIIYYVQAPLLFTKYCYDDKLRMIWEEYNAAGVKNSHKVLVWKPERTRPFWKSGLDEE
jgi:hypothetical protein